jgi:hypothetical protein
LQITNYGWLDENWNCCTPRLGEVAPGRLEIGMITNCGGNLMEIMDDDGHEIIEIRCMIPLYLKPSLQTFVIYYPLYQ